VPYFVSPWSSHWPSCRCLIHDARTTVFPLSRRVTLHHAFICTERLVQLGASRSLTLIVRLDLRQNTEFAFVHGVAIGGGGTVEVTGVAEATYVGCIDCVDCVNRADCGQRWRLLYSSCILSLWKPRAPARLSIGVSLVGQRCRHRDGAL
jgi:hypothetical protein